MADAVSSLLSDVRRRFVVSEVSVVAGPDDVSLAGEHPVPGAGSEHAGRRLLDFLAAPGGAEVTLFCVSGGASSLCVAARAAARPRRPGDDLGARPEPGMGHHAAEPGARGDVVDRRRSGPSSRSHPSIAVPRHGRQRRRWRSWVASGAHLRLSPSAAERGQIVDGLRPLPEDVARRLEAGLARRDELMAGPVTTDHENRVLVEPGAGACASCWGPRGRGAWRRTPSERSVPRSRTSCPTSRGSWPRRRRGSSASPGSAR